MNKKKYHIKMKDIYSDVIDCWDILAYSFHLPVDVLTDPRFEIIDPVVLDPSSIPEQHKKELYIDGVPLLFWNAKRVAISARKILDSGEEMFVGRIWFGKEVKS